MHKKIIIVGTGFAGSVLARKIAEECNIEVLILEKRNHIAGNMYDEYMDGVLIQKYGPHFFATNEWWIMEYLKKFSDFYEYPIKAISYIDGKYIDRPYNLRSIQQLIGPENTENIFKTLRSQFEGKRRISLFDLLNSKCQELVNLGEILYKEIYAPYIAKQWGKRIDEVDPLIVNRAQIVLGYDTQLIEYDYQYLPTEGYTALFKKMLDHPNIKVMLNVDATSYISFDSDVKKVMYNGDYVDALVFTGQIDSLFKYEYGRLPYRSRRFTYETNFEKILPYPGVVTYPKNYEYLRQTEFLHFNPSIEGNMKSVLQTEYSVSMDENDVESEPFYPILNNENNELYQEYKNKADEFSNLFLCGRLAEYKYYDMDAVIMRAFDIFERMKQEKIV